MKQRKLSLTVEQKENENTVKRNAKEYFVEKIRNEFDQLKHVIEINKKNYII